MYKFKKSLSLIILSILLIFTACSDYKDDSRAIGDRGDIIATVNGRAISKKQYDNFLEYFKDDIEYKYGEGVWEAESENGLSYREYYEDLIMDEMTMSLLLLDVAEKEGFIATDEEIEESLYVFKVYFKNDKEYEDYLYKNNISEETLKEDLEKEIVVNNYVAWKLETYSLSDNELEDIFEDLKIDSQVRLSHILVRSEKEALGIVERIDKGESFAELAMESSMDQDSGVKGGDLGYFSYFEVGDTFFQDLFYFEIGQVCQPIQSEYGYHIVKLTDRISDDSKTLESEKGTLTEYYKRYKFEDHIEELKKGADIVKK